MLFGDQHVLKLYNNEDSYFWKNRKELLEICDVLKEKDLFIDCDLLNQFKSWQAEREDAKKDQNPEQIAHIIDRNETSG